MSRLDSFINRMTAQRILLNQARDEFQGIPGVVFELGLGNGRSFDHLREIFPDRHVYVFDMEIRSHPTSRPDDEHAILGEIEETLPVATEEHAGRVILIHSDIGSHQEEHCERMKRVLNANVYKALAPGGVIFSDLALEIPGMEPYELPDGVWPGRYFAARKPKAE